MIQFPVLGRLQMKQASVLELAYHMQPCTAPSHAGLGMACAAGLEKPLGLGSVLGNFTNRRTSSVRFWVRVRVRVRRCGINLCPMYQSQNVMVQAIFDIPFHGGARYDPQVTQESP